jgi:hypothetical protein
MQLCLSLVSAKLQIYFYSHVINTSIKTSSITTLQSGCAIAQAVSRQLPTEAARVRPHVRLCGICGYQRGTKAGFLRVLWSPLSILIPSTAPRSFVTLSPTLYSPDTDSVIK